MNHNFELIIFDWDGTIMDSEAHIVDCLRVSMAEVNADFKSDLELREVIGLGLPEAIARLLPDSDNVTKTLAVQAFRDEFLSPKESPSRLFDGARELLTLLKDQGFWLAVATGKSRRGLDKVMDETGLGSFFAVTRTADETFSKPNPLMLEEILVDMDTAASSALMVGDTSFDLQMATNVGMPSAGVSYGVHPIERLQTYKPLIIADSLEELGVWLGQSKNN